MIDLKKFEKKKTTKPAGELTPNDIGSLIKVIDINGVEVSDILVAFYAGEISRNRNAINSYDGKVVSVSLQHAGSYRDQYDGCRGSMDLNPGMRVVVQRPISDE